MLDEFHYVLHPDGQRFLVPALGGGRSPITIVMNWQAALRR